MRYSDSLWASCFCRGREQRPTLGGFLPKPRFLNVDRSILRVNRNQIADPLLPMPHLLAGTNVRLLFWEAVSLDDLSFRILDRPFENQSRERLSFVE